MAEPKGEELAARFNDAELEFLSRLADNESRAVLLAGSYARGWEHSHSDIDVSIVLGAPSVDTATITEVRHRLVYHNGKRWDIEYWPNGFVELLASAVARANASVEAGIDPTSILGGYEVGRALRLYDSVALTGAEYAADCKALLHRAGLGRLVVGTAVEAAEAALDAALGLGSYGDIRTATLAVAGALEHSVDAYAAAHGVVTPGSKWRFRRYESVARMVCAGELPMEVETCWRWLSLADLDGATADQWINDATEACQILLSAVSEIDGDGAPVTANPPRDVARPGAEK
ncbi:nucleotidyltransferase domain-containing protein [Actinomadura sp. 6N118]|uniref:nucleotidyltransferase domain-containing protein n=1 Tax=Actinomadura sp. 6N118 TaxID=3375151 RepID=UPI0037A0D704